MQWGDLSNGNKGDCSSSRHSIYLSSCHVIVVTMGFRFWEPEPFLRKQIRAQVEGECTECQSQFHIFSAVESNGLWVTVATQRQDFDCRNRSETVLLVFGVEPAVRHRRLWIKQSKDKSETAGNWESFKFHRLPVIDGQTCQCGYAFWWHLWISET